MTNDQPLTTMRVYSHFTLYLRFQITKSVSIVINVESFQNLLRYHLKMPSGTGEATAQNLAIATEIMAALPKMGTLNDARQAAHRLANEVQAETEAAAVNADEAPPLSACI